MDGARAAHGDLPGGSMDPEAAYLLIEESKRWDCAFATVRKREAVAKFGEASESCSRFLSWFGFASDHKLAKKQMRGFGSMLAFEFEGGLPAARRVCDRVQLFLLAASLGGVESLVFCRLILRTTT